MTLVTLHYVCIVDMVVAAHRCCSNVSPEQTGASRIAKRTPVTCAQGMHPGMLPPGAVPMPMTGEWTEGGMYYPFYYTDYS